jgi:hypothetical protein
MEDKKKIGDINAKWEDIKCEHLSVIDLDNQDKKYCQLASEAQGWKIETTPYLCSVCLGCDTPKQIGNPGVRLATRRAAAKAKKQIKMAPVEKLGEGPGTELHKLIPAFLEGEDCDCKNWARKMNVWGVDGCEKNRKEIVCKLVNESRKRPILAWVPNMAIQVVADKLLTTAINNYTKKEKLEKYKWFVAVTTAPRREPTLSTCLESMIIAGWNATVFAEPGDYNFLNDEYKSRLIFNKEKLGVWRNWVHSCRYALENSDANVIMTVQDDSVFHPDSKTFAEKFFWPSKDVGFLSLYTPKHYHTKPRMKTAQRPIGLNRIPTKSLWGACAMIWPRKVLEEVMKHNLIENWFGCETKSKDVWEKRLEERKREPWRIQNSDTAIGKIIRSMKRSQWFFDPSPVQHVAKHSAINHGGNLGRRNCGRCAKYSVPLAQQLPFHLNGMERFQLFDYENIEV